MTTLCVGKNERERSFFLTSPHPRETRVHRNCRRRAPRTIDLEGWNDCCRGSFRASARTYVDVKENKSKTHLSHLSVLMLPPGPSRTSTPPEVLAICSTLKMTPPSSTSHAGDEVEGSSSSSDDDDATRQLLTARLFLSCATTFQLGVVGVDDERVGRTHGDGEKGELAAASDATCIAAGAGWCVLALHQRCTLVVGCHRSKKDVLLFFCSRTFLPPSHPDAFQHVCDFSGHYHTDTRTDTSMASYDVQLQF